MKIVEWPFKIIKRSFIWLTIGGLCIIGSWVVFVTAFKPSIEFTGWVQMTLSNAQQVETITIDIKDAIVAAWFPETTVNMEDKGGIVSLLVSLPSLSDDQVKEVNALISQTLVNKKHITSDEDIIGSAVNGPSVSSYMQSTAIQAIAAALIMIAIYMAFAFASMRKYISPVILAFVAIGTMVFDISIPIGVYGLVMMRDSTMVVDTIFVMAILATMAYSIGDTIVVLDRIRENSKNSQESLDNRQLMYGTLIETSLRQTMRRSISTGLALFLTIIAMYIFGEWAMKAFAFTMGVGVIAGSCSSIFIAPSLAFLLMGKWKKELQRL